MKVQQAALPTGDEYASGLTGLAELVQKYEQVYKENTLKRHLGESRTTQRTR